MKQKFKRILSCLSAILMIVSITPTSKTFSIDVVNKTETMVSSENEVNRSDINRYITLEDVKALNAFLLNTDYIGSGEVIDVNNDNQVNGFDLCLTKNKLLESGVPSLVNFSADYRDIYLNNEETVAFTVDVTAIKPIEENDIAIYDETDTFVAYMNDDGVEGDEIANDGVYSIALSLSSEDIKTVNYYAATDEVQSNSYEICFYRDLEKDEFLNFFKLHNTISQFSFEDACNYVKTSKEIKSYDINESNKSIIYQSIYGIYGSWEDEESFLTGIKGTGNFALPDSSGMDYQTANNTIDSVNITATHSNKKDVIVLRPFRGTEFTYDDFKTAGETLANALDCNVTVVDDGDVTLEQMKSLSSYGTVMIDSHGALKGIFSKTPYMLIGEELNEDKFLWDPGYYLQHVNYSADYISGRIYCTGYHDRLAVGGTFFEKYYSNNSLSDSF